MLLQRAMIVSVMAATALPVVAAYAAEATPAAPSPAIESSPPSPAPEWVPSVPMEGRQFDAKPAGLNYKLDVPAAAPRPDAFRYDFAQRPAPEAVLRLTPDITTLRAGWALSGRMGPLRWLSPIDGEGGATMRLWGRVQGQPATPGLGSFNISIHYTFD